MGHIDFRILLFYVALYFVVDLLARRKRLIGLEKSELNISWTSVAKRLYLLIPVIMLVYQIMSGRALSSATLDAIRVTIVFGLITQLLEGFRATGINGALKSMRNVLVDSLKALDSGSRGAIAVAIPCAGAGIVVGIAKTKIWKTGWVAFRYSLAGFLVAFAFVFSPALLLQGEWIRIIPSVLTAITGCYALASCVAGYLRARNTPLESVLLLIAAVLLIAPVLKASAAGLVMLGAVWAWQSHKARFASRGAELERSRT